MTHTTPDVIPNSLNDMTDIPHPLKHLFENNRLWVNKMLAEDSAFFSRLSHLQTPEILWIGCSDSRVPANQITGLAPGEIFVHRNIANVVVHTDLNALSVIEFAVNSLKIKHIIVCGHYGCGGVNAALNNIRTGSLVDNWLRHIQDVRDEHSSYLGSVLPKHQSNALCELNVIEQVRHVVQTSTVQDAWIKGQPLTVHGWIYDIKDGVLRDLSASVSHLAELNSTLNVAIANINNTSRQ
jgi:carbonic anhydrase